MARLNGSKPLVCLDENRNILNETRLLTIPKYCTSILFFENGCNFFFPKPSCPEYRVVV